MIRFFYILSLILTSISVNGQTIIWSEYFQTYTTHPTQIGQDNNLPIGSDWSMSWVDCDDGATGVAATTLNQSYFGTRNTTFSFPANVELLCNDIEGGPCCGLGGTANNEFTTELIDISAYASVTFSVKHRFGGTHECVSSACDNSYDKFEMMYSVDGGPFISSGIACGSNGKLQGCISGINTIRLKFRMGNKANDEFWFMDSIVVVGSPIVCGFLPVKLSSFEGKLLNGQPTLFWTTESELNSSHFIVERSQNGEDFEQIGIVYSQNNGYSNTPLFYRYVDEHPLDGITYYRLQQVDINGEYTNYGLVVIDNKKESITIVKTVNILGNEVNSNEGGLLVQFYSDGSVIKTFKY